MDKLLTLVLLIFFAYLVSGDSTPVFTNLVPDDKFEDFETVHLKTLEKGKPFTLNSSKTAIVVTDFNGSIYSDSFSQLQNVTKLGFYKSSITEIEDEAFCPPNLRTLVFDFWENPIVPNFRKSIFKSCDQLEEFYLRFNYWHFQASSDYKIDPDVLENLHNLKLLIFVKHFKLKKLDKNVLNLKLPKLTQIEFHDCEIEDIDENAFNELPKLKKITIRSNPNLRTLPKNVFKNNVKLESIILSDNFINDLPWDQLGNLANLTTFDVEHNAISNFEDDKIADKIAKSFPNLEYLKIHGNPSPESCADKRAFEKKLKSKMRYVHVYYYYCPFKIGSTFDDD